MGGGGGGGGCRLWSPCPVRTAVAQRAVAKHFTTVPKWQLQNISPVSTLTLKIVTKTKNKTNNRTFCSLEVTCKRTLNILAVIKKTPKNTSSLRLETLVKTLRTDEDTYSCLQTNLLLCHKLCYLFSCASASCWKS